MSDQQPLHPTAQRLIEAMRAAGIPNTLIERVRTGDLFNEGSGTRVLQDELRSYAQDRADNDDEERAADVDELASQLQIGVFEPTAAEKTEWDKLRESGIEGTN